MAFVSDPAHARFYGDNNDRMPSYGPEKSLSEAEIGLDVDWLRGEWFMPKPMRSGVRDTAKAGAQ